MNRCKIFIVCFLIGIMSYSCDNLLEMTPENQITFENGLETETDIESALNSTGGFVRSGMAKGNWANWVRGICCDTTTYLLERNFGYTSMPVYLWDEHYKVIASANVVLAYVDDVDMPKERKDYYRGSAYFYKSLAYFELIRCWGDCVLVDEEVSMDSEPKSYWTKVADYAIDLAEKAVALLPDFDKVVLANGKPAQYKSQPCKGAANAVLANLCAWKAGCKYLAQPSERNYDENELWRKVEIACTAIIGSETGVATGCYRLASNPEDVCTKVLVGGDEESIYESVYKDFWNELGRFAAYNDNAISFQTYPMLNYSPQTIRDAAVRIKAETVRKMFTNTDLRRDAYFYDFEKMASPDLIEITGGYAYPYKYREVAVYTSGDQAGEFFHIDQNRVWWRLADIYLLRAECRVHLDKRDLAIADINTIRSRANAPLYNGSEYGGDLQLAVFKEREKELLFEGHRYFDIVRNNYIHLLGTGFRALSDQDLIDGALFWGISVFPFVENPKLRQNTYWQRFVL